MKTTVYFKIEDGIHKAESCSIQYEFSAIDLLMGDVERTVSEMAENVLQQIDVEYTIKPFPLPVTVKIEALVAGITIDDGRVYDKDTHAELEKPPKRELDSDSIKNDIRYIDSMLGSESPVIDVRRWIYHVLNKHFDVPLPDAFNKAVSEPVK